jgi:hypothetical protein
MLRLTGEQLETLDRLCEQTLEQRIVRAMERIFGAQDRDVGTPPSTPIAEAVRVASEEAARLDIARPADFAALAAFVAGCAQLAKADAAAVRESIKPLFTRSDSPGATVLALVQARMQALASDHPFAERLLSHMAHMRRAFE